MPIYENPGPRYRDREDAGRVLAARLSDYRHRETIVLAVPNGGIPVAAVIAEELGAPMSLIIVRKLQIPDNPEAGFGALAPDGSMFLNQALVKRLGLTESDILRQKEKAFETIRSRQEYFGKNAEPPPLNNRTAVMVDDGLASGFTMEAAVKSVRGLGAERIVIAVPTSSMSAYRRLETRVDRIICPDLSRLRIFAVADAYENWYDLDDEEALETLESPP